MCIDYAFKDTIFLEDPYAVTSYMMYVHAIGFEISKLLITRIGPTCLQQIVLNRPIISPKHKTCLSTGDLLQSLDQEHLNDSKEFEWITSLKKCSFSFGKLLEMPCQLKIESTLS